MLDVLVFLFFLLWNISNVVILTDERLYALGECFLIYSKIMYTHLQKKKIIQTFKNKK